MANITLFAQVIQHLPQNIFKKIFAEHNSDKHSKGFDSYSHLISMVFCQFANCVSQGALKLHTQLDFNTLLPEFVYITDGKATDGKAASEVRILPHLIVVADRGYCDFSLLNYWDSMKVFFVVRHKNNLVYRRIEEHPLPEKRHQDILIDETIELERPKTKEKYPKRLRRIAVFNEEHGYTVERLTNNMSLAASSIAELYRFRWEIELFFRVSSSSSTSKASWELLAMQSRYSCGRL